jgi:hypothetical protein
MPVTLPVTFAFGGSAGMTFLQLVQRAMRDCGATGASLSTVAGASGEAQRFVDWVAQAWVEIQTKRDDWQWLRSSNLLGGGISFTTVGGQAVYPIGTGAGNAGIDPAIFGKWDEDAFRLYTTAVGTNDETPLGCIPYDAWRNGWMISSARAVQTRPEIIAIAPNKSLCLGPPPTSLYTVTGDYYLAPSAMAADGDVPTGLPGQFHMAIVYLAMTYYAGYEAAPEVLARGQAGYGSLMGRLEGLQAEGITTGGPLA